MPGWLRSVAFGPLTSMLSNVTSTARSNQNQRKGRRGEEDDRPREVHTGSGRWSPGTKGRRDVDARFRPRVPAPAGDGVAGADRSCASVKMGTVRRRSESGRRGAGEALNGRDADAAGL